MLKYVCKRFVLSVLTLLVLATLTFFLVKLIPGNPFLDESIPPVIQAKQAAYYGLDKPVYIQYLTYMKNLLHGDLGTSLKYQGRSVASFITEFFGNSAKLGIASMLFSTIIGMGFGIICSQNKDKPIDYILVFLAVLGIALPSMVIGPVVRYFFGVKLGWFPVSGLGASWKQIIMPMFCMGIGGLSGETRSTRALMLGVSTEDYIKTARAKGLTNSEVLWRHQFRNGMIPMVTGLGTQLAGIFTGSFVIERMFVIPGLGKHFTNSVTSLDYPLVMGLTIFYGAILIAGNFIVDILYGIVDPRIRID